VLIDYFFEPNPAIRSKSSRAAHPAGFPLLSGVWLRNLGTKGHRDISPPA
jgi:hypothetical protein